jgi:cytochrome c peroxidase
MKRFAAISLAFLCFTLIVLWNRSQSRRSGEMSAAEATEANWANEPIQPIPLATELNGEKEKVALGEKLFQDPQLSRNNTVSCASCHSLSTGGSDLLARSVGIDGQQSLVNAPTVFNSGFNFKQFWDGRAETLEDQIDGPIHTSSEMDSNWPEIIKKLAQSPDYVAAFGGLYDNGIQGPNVKDALATFERSLATPNSRFDRFLRGDGDALSNEEKEGYRLFKSYGCASCHQGVSAGGNIFQKFGVMGDYFADRGEVSKADMGRFNVTGDEADRHVFKVPSLRNVALTPPYFHDGSAARLEDAVVVMGRYQLGRRLSPDEVDRIVKFLRTLTGEYRGKSL